MKTINIFTENIFDGWEVNEKDVIQKTREMLEHYIQTLGDRSCLFEKEYQTITLDIVFCDSAKTHELNRDYRNKDYPADIITFAIFADDENSFIFDHRDEEEYNFVIGEQRKALECINYDKI